MPSRYSSSFSFLYVYVLFPRQLLPPPRADRHRPVALAEERVVMGEGPLRRRLLDGLQLGLLRHPLPPAADRPPDGDGPPAMATTAAPAAHAHAIALLVVVLLLVRVRALYLGIHKLD